MGTGEERGKGEMGFVELDGFALVGLEHGFSWISNSRGGGRGLNSWFQI